jgi:hypothetical protein
MQIQRQRHEQLMSKDDIQRMKLQVELQRLKLQEQAIVNTNTFMSGEAGPSGG